MHASIHDLQIQKYFTDKQEKKNEEDEKSKDKIDISTYKRNVRIKPMGIEEKIILLQKISQVSAIGKKLGEN